MTFKRQLRQDDDSSTQSNDFEQMLQESFGKSDRKLSVGEKVKCEVISVGKEQVIVSTGTRFDGFVQATELLDEDGQSKVKAGDHIDLFVTYIKGGQIFLSSGAGSQGLAEDIQQAYETGLSVEGRVESSNKGGFSVTILGKACFCPMSQMDMKRIERPEEYVGQKFQFKITEIKEGGRNIVVSRRKILEDGQGAAMASFKDQRKVGDVVTGTVKRVEPFGAFIEIAPGLEGLAHVSELAWSRVNNPSDVVKPGQVVTATIIRIEQEERRLKISLTLKQAANDPWQNLPAQIQTGRVVSGKVTRCMPFGAFVELVPGIEGLVPLSEMSSTKRVNSADEVVKPGEQITVLIKEINTGSKRVSLSIKGAVDQAASDSETQDIREYNASQVARGSSASSMGAIGAKLQAALDKQTKK
ncbi:MAG: S1 RNA-binding domain-containing protein [Bdellovibrionota bacterium]